METNSKIGTDSLFLLDSGGQYLDGTTDVTRTYHFGEPTTFQKEAYTRVLMGAVDLARGVFRWENTYLIFYNVLDSLFYQSWNHGY